MISTNPTAVGEAEFSVNDALAVKSVTLNVWSAHEMPNPSIRSVQPAATVNVGVPSATQVACIAHLTVVRVSASHVEVVEEAFWRTLTAPIGVIWWTL